MSLKGCDFAPNGSIGSHRVETKSKDDKKVDACDIELNECED